MVELFNGFIQNLNIPNSHDSLFAATQLNISPADVPTLIGYRTRYQGPPLINSMNPSDLLFTERAFANLFAQQVSPKLKPDLWVNFVKILRDKINELHQQQQRQQQQQQQQYQYQQQQYQQQQQQQQPFRRHFMDYLMEGKEVPENHNYGLNNHQHDDDYEAEPVLLPQKNTSRIPVETSGGKRTRSRKRGRKSSRHRRRKSIRRIHKKRK